VGVRSCFVTIRRVSEAREIGSPVLAEGGVGPSARRLRQPPSNVTGRIPSTSKLDPPGGGPVSSGKRPRPSEAPNKRSEPCQVLNGHLDMAGQRMP
jgi:hypothetical protein